MKIKNAIYALLLISAPFGIKAYDLFEQNVEVNKNKVRVASFEKLSGAKVEFNSLEKEALLLNNTGKGNSTLKASNSQISKFVVHRANSNTYETKDFKTWTKAKNDEYVNEQPALKQKPGVVVNNNELIISGAYGQEYEIYSILGLLLSQGKVEAKSIDISVLNPGLYVLVVNKEVSKFLKY